jgi:hypothetical protein
MRSAALETVEALPQTDAKVPGHGTSITGTETWQWIGPDGTVRPSTETLDMVARSPGRAIVRLQAIERRAWW